MNLVWKAAAAALFSAVMGLLLKRHYPEGALLLGSVTALGILIASMGLLDGLRSLREQVGRMMGQDRELLIGPVLKCLSIAIITRLAADLCRDASQSAAASSVELAGTVCAMTTALPLLLSVLKMIGGML